MTEAALNLPLRLAALAVFLALPGMVLVRVPWRLVPLVSSAFWILTWWWMPSAGRTRFLHASLFLFGGLALLRLLRPLTLTTPGVAATLVVAASLLRLAPGLVWPVGPGEALAAHATQTQLLVWHDGLPATSEPLMGPVPFGSVQPGMPSLAADMTLLVHEPPYATTWLVTAAAGGLVQLALWSLVSRFASEGVAAAASVGALAVLGLVEAFAREGEGGALLATAFALAAVDLTLTRKTRASAFAAGLLVAATAASDARLVVGFAALAGLAVLLAPGRRRALALRGGAAIVCGAVLASPFLGRMRVSGFWNGVADSAVDASLMTRWPAIALLVLTGAAATGFAMRRWLAARDRAPAAMLVVAVLAAWGGLRVISGYRECRARVPIGHDDIAAMRWMSASAGPLDVVCCAGPACAWIPGIAGRRVAGPFPAHEEHPCRLEYLPLPAAVRSGRIVFENNGVRIIERSE